LFVICVIKFNLYSAQGEKILDGERIEIPMAKPDGLRQNYLALVLEGLSLDIPKYIASKIQKYR